jgi:hypothetical protein
VTPKNATYGLPAHLINNARCTCVQCPDHCSVPGYKRTSGVRSTRSACSLHGPPCSLQTITSEFRPCEGRFYRDQRTEGTHRVVPGHYVLIISAPVYLSEKLSGKRLCRSEAFLAVSGRRGNFGTIFLLKEVVFRSEFHEFNTKRIFASTDYTPELYLHQCCIMKSALRSRSYGLQPR